VEFILLETVEAIKGNLSDPKVIIEALRNRLLTSPQDEKSTLLSEINKLLNELLKPPGFNQTFGSSRSYDTTTNNVSEKTSKVEGNEVVIPDSDRTDQTSSVTVASNLNENSFVQELHAQFKDFDTPRVITEEERELHELVLHNQAKVELNDKAELQILNKSFGSSSEKNTLTKVSAEEEELKQLLQDALGE